MKSKLLFLVLLCLLYHDTLAAAVIGIDYGAEWVKTGIVRTGQPIDIVLNENTKRKVSTSVAICGDKVHVSDDARSMETRMPNCVFTYPRDLLGQKYDVVKNGSYQNRHLYDIAPHPDRGTVVLTDSKDIKKNDEDDVSYYTAEEISGILLDTVRKYSEAAALDGDFAKATAEHDRIIRDCVISVPSHFDVFQRQAVYDAAELAGLNVLGLVNDHLAASLQYLTSGKIKTTAEFPSFKFWDTVEEGGKNEAQTMYDISEIRAHLPNTSEPIVMIYDMGSTETQVSVVKFSGLQFNVVPPAMRADEVLGLSTPTPKDEPKKQDKKQPFLGQIEVLAAASDKNLGGYSFDMAISDYMKKQFLAKHPQREQELNSNIKAAARLRREANRIKHILSANDAADAYVEQIVPDADLHVKMTREIFEAISADLLARAILPVEAVLKYANVSTFDLWAVEVIGGTVRIPMVKRALRTYLGRSSLDHKIDGDEGIAYGAAFYGAILSAQFRVADVKLRDINLDDVIININGTNDKNVSTVVVAAGTKIPTKKRIRLERTEDMTISMISNNRQLEAYRVTGIESVLNKSDTPLDVNITVKVASDGITFISGAEASVRIEEKICPNDTKPVVNPKPASDDDDEAAAESEESAKKIEEEPAENVTECVVKLRTKIIPLTVTRLYSSDIPALSDAQFQQSRATLRILERREKKRLQRAEALNALEAFLYETRDIMYDDEHEIHKYSTAEEKETLINMLTQKGNWLEENSETATMEEFKEAKNDLFALADKFKKRMREAKTRPMEIKELKSSLNISKNLVDKWAVEITARMAMEKIEEEAAKEAALKEEEAKKDADKEDAAKEEPEEPVTENTETKPKEVPKKKNKKSSVPLMQMYEVENIKSIINETSEWLTEAVKNQDSKLITDDPVLLTSEIKRKRDKLESELMYLLRKKTSDRPPVKDKTKKEKPIEKDEL